MIISGVRAVKFAEKPGFSASDLLKGLQPLGEYDANGPWSNPVDDNNSGEFTDVTEVRDGVEVHVSTLTFNLCDGVSPNDLPIGCNPQAWRFQERDGKTYFIGSGKKPYPTRVINSDNTRGNNAKKTSITITWTSKCGPMIIK